MEVDLDTVMGEDDDEENSAWVSGSNLFAETNLPHPGELHALSQLLGFLFEHFRERKLSTLQVAEELGVSEVVATNLMELRINEISINELFDYLETLGFDAEIAVQPRTYGRRISLRRQAKARR